MSKIERTCRCPEGAQSRLAVEAAAAIAAVVAEQNMLRWSLVAISPVRVVRVVQDRGRNSSAINGTRPGLPGGCRMGFGDLRWDFFWCAWAGAEAAPSPSPCPSGGGG
jgi:hypothetical protein